MSNDLLYQIALTQIPHVGVVQAKILIEHFEDAQSIFKAKKKDLSAIDHVGEVRAKCIKDFQDFAAAEKEIEFITQYKIQPLFITDEGYPNRLLNCYDAPTMLYYKGNADLNTARIISIIGTRSSTDYGRLFTEQLIKDIKGTSPLIVSGLAFGIDTIAHKSALQNGLSTAAVLGHGFQTIYPSQHKSLAKEITANGGLLTEFASNTKPDKHNFPRRNRIVAGMADATVVIETAVKGGSMITAELANNYNRDVFALPGRISDTKSAGCNYLIKTHKAALMTNADDVLEMMNWKSKKLTAKLQRELFADLSADEKKIVVILGEKDSVHIDEIYLRSNIGSSSVAAAILNLELQNVIASLPGKMYQLI